jgi:uncharacterized glyoxalase superfamily protein PhnB
LKALFIFYVADQEKSAKFYSSVLAQTPTLDVPGMTEFELNDGSLLGLMPESGIKKMLGNDLPDPASAQGVPRAELYLILNNPEEYHARALQSGATELSPMQDRPWGDRAAYSLDPDGHVLAFASPADKL